MDHKEIEEAFNETFAGLTMYYRDCNLNPSYISKYEKNQILLERGFTDVSNFAQGMHANLRYAIASNKAVNMAQVNPEVRKFGFHLIAAPSHYKVLDIYKIDEQTQVLLLHFDKKFEAIFSETNSNIEEKVIGMGRQSLDKKIQMEPNKALHENEWTQRTQFPIGMSDTGNFFYTAVDTTQQETTSVTPPQTPETSNNTSAATPKTDEKKSFWKKLFGQ
ncbi:MAG: hypothetical protein AB8B65_02410 [Kordia sp.]|uniref:hypothetical protein n=1 Tax=Kordia sp. TaxID=1965332 RepID=UPI00385DCA5E